MERVLGDEHVRYGTDGDLKTPVGGLEKAAGSAPPCSKNRTSVDTMNEILGHIS